MCLLMFFFFFFQAEDGIRDLYVTGVQTCALPISARVIEEFRARTREPTLTRPSATDLTSREWEVLDCLSEGLSTRRIAKRLFISETTVRRHVGAILKKLNVPNRQAAAKVAAQRSQN